MALKAPVLESTPRVFSGNSLQHLSVVRGWNWLEHGFAALMVQLQSVCSQLALSILSEPQIMMVVISNLELKEMLSGSECLGFLSWAQGG